jgi:hypothetical protein
VVLGRPVVVLGRPVVVLGSTKPLVQRTVRGRFRNQSSPIFRSAVAFCAGAIPPMQDFR